MAKLPSTPALRFLRQHNIAFTAHVIAYKEKGGTAHSAEVLGKDEHHVIKTLIFEDWHKTPMCILMHGDKQVSTKKLARAAGAKTIKPCDPKVAEKHSGYRVGGTSPFGLRKQMPLYIEASIVDLDAIIINGGARGVLVELAPQALVEVLGATPVSAAQD